MSNWTPEQENAINADGMGIIVSAAAGSGKTSVLVERLVRILSDKKNKTPADRLVVVTFTNDAALQMKQRLYSKLSERLAEDPGNTWLCSQQTLLQTAKISTIHSFCFDMIRENVQSLDISAGFRILDDAEASVLMRNAAANTFEKFYAERPDTMEMLCDFFSSSSRGDTELEETLLSVYRFLVSLPFYKDKMKEWEDFYASGFSEKNDAFAKIYEEYVCDFYEEMHSKFSNLDKEYKNKVSDSKAIENDASIVSAMKENAREDQDWNKKFSKNAGDFSQIERVKKDELTEEQKEARSKLLKKRNDYKSKIKVFNSKLFTIEEINDDYKKHAEILKALFEMVRCFDDELHRLKNEKNALSFSDAEQLAIALLAEKDDKGKIVKTKLAKELSEYYSVVMIDEFQDANDNQDLIFKMLSKDGTAERGGTNLFTVGDIKQSIYRFRLANPQLFKNALSIAEEYSENGEYKPNVKILLNKNFRSSKEVIGFVNFVFKNLMSVSVGDVDYTAAEELVYGADYEEAERDTEIIIVPDSSSAAKDTADDSASDGGQQESEKQDPEQQESEKQDPEQQEDEEDNNFAESEAYAAAIKIHSMLGVKKVYEGKTSRPCEPRDFCILVRSNKKSEVYVKALAEMGIKAHAEEPKGYLRSREISALMSMLSVVDDPMQNIPLTAVLMSPMFMLSADDMAVVSLVKKDEKKFFNKIKAIMEKDTDDIVISEGLFAKLERFMKTFEKLRYCAASQKLDRFIRTIYDSTDLLSTVQTYKDGNVKKANLRLLLDIAESYEKNSGGGISGFVRYTDNMIRRGADMNMASSVSAGDNAVSVKTIHKSKGLEYPFVFLCGTSTEFNTKDQEKRIQMNSEYGIALKIQERDKFRAYKSFPVSVISSVNGRNSVSEEMRLLYVALTRAKEQLFITIPDNEKIRKKISSAKEYIETYNNAYAKAAGKAGSMLEWIAEAMFIADKDWDKKEKVTDIGGVKVRTIVQDMKDPALKAEAKVSAKPDADKVNALKKLFAFSYEGEGTVQPAKMTVTEIAKGGAEEEFVLRRPEFAEENGLTAAERGTALHTFMQYADYAAAENDISKEAERLAEIGIMSAEEVKSLNKRQISGFFRSELYQRMKRSDIIRREQKFLVKKSDISLDGERFKEYNNDSMIQGTADCFFEENGGIVLVDHKTDRVDSPEELTERYSLQIKLYAAALSKIYGKEVREAYLYSFALGETVPVQLS